MVVGLGNPGRKYVETRHNIGFKVIEQLSERLGIEVVQKKFGGLFGAGEYAGEKLILLMPQEFMNRSGQSVATAAGFYKLSADEVLIVTDDMALDVGRIRVRAKGSAGGHNGLADIIQKLGTQEVGRVRVGIGRSEFMGDVDFVLGRPSEDEKPLLNEAIVRAAEAVESCIGRGLEAAMNEFNRE